MFPHLRPDNHDVRSPLQVGVASAIVLGALLVVPSFVRGDSALHRQATEFAAAAVSAGNEELTTVPIVPVRILDSRPGEAALAGTDVAWGPGETRTVSAAGIGAIPNDALGIVGNVTAVNSTEETFLTLFPTGSPRPLASTLNPTPTGTVFNAATVRLGGGTFELYNLKGTVDVIIDVTGYLTANLSEDVERLNTGELLAPYVTASVGVSPGPYAPMWGSVGRAAAHGFFLEPARYLSATIRAEGLVSISQSAPTGSEPAAFELCVRLVGPSGPLPGSDTCVLTTSASALHSSTYPGIDPAITFWTRLFRFVGPKVPLVGDNLYFEVRATGQGQAAITAHYVRVYQ